MNVEDFEFPDSEDEEDIDKEEFNQQPTVEELNPQPTLTEIDEVPDALQTLGYGKALSDC